MNSRVVEDGFCGWTSFLDCLETFMELLCGEGSRGVLAQLDGDPHFGGLDILSFKTCARLTYSATSKGSDTLFARRPFSPFVLSSVV
jgi:hypothetical protein